MRFIVGDFYFITRNLETKIVRCMSTCESSIGTDQTCLFLEFDKKNNNLIGKSFSPEKEDQISHIQEVPSHWRYCQEIWRRYEV